MLSRYQGSGPRSRPRLTNALPGSGDVRDHLRADQDEALALLDSMEGETDPERRSELLVRLRRTWRVHLLALETVIYHTLESAGTDTGPFSPADARVIEHELLEVFFEKLGRACRLGDEWTLRLAIVEDVIQRNVKAERRELFAQLDRQCDSSRLRELGQQYVLASEKLSVLEDAKARAAARPTD